MVDSTSRIFGERLKQLMKKQGYSFRKLEAVTGIPFNTLNDYANGRVSVPLVRAKIIADTLGESVDWMAGGASIKLIKKMA